MKSGEIGHTRDEAAEAAGSSWGAGGGAGAVVLLPSQPSVSVIICSYTEERWQDLARAVRSVQDQSEPAAEIILVVDHCPALLARAEVDLPGITILANRFQQGLAGARNTGVEAATTDVVAFLDDDAAADPGWIASLAGAYADPQVAGVGGEVRPAWDAGRPRWFPPELDWVVGCSYLGLPVEPEPVRNFIGANMSFRREVLDSLPGFSADLGRVGATPLGCEETEFCLRVGQRYPDSLLLYQPAAGVSHRVASQRARWRYLWARCYAEGLSKAKVAAMAGPRLALASERRYVRSQIPRGVARSLLAAGRGSRAGLLAALALIGAVVVTGAGYLVGKVAAVRSVRRAAALRPVRKAASLRGIGWAGPALAVILWAVALQRTDLSRLPASGLGLIPELPVTFWLALAVVTAGFCGTVVRRSTRWPLLAAYLLVLAAILHVTPVLLYGTLRYSWAWKHVGVIDFIMHHGVVFNLGGIFGPYQGWPGFFALNSFLVTASGQSSALGYASWALPVSDLLWLGPVLLIARSFSRDRRLVWTAAWLFELGNWVGQDYFSPQAFTYFLYLVVIAVCLRWLWAAERARGDTAGGDLPPSAASLQLPRSTRLVLAASLVPLMIAIASSHQLTPFMLIAALTLLAVFGQLRPLAVPLAMLVITVGWLAYGALDWLSTDPTQILSGIGLPWANASAHLIGGGSVPPDQLIVEWSARLLSAAIAATAVIGFFRYRRHHGALARRSWQRAALLAVAALPSVAANSYGGEIIFRVFMFVLPFAAVTAAAAFFPHPGWGRSRLAGPALLTVTLLLAAGFTVANYGQEAINYFTPGEVAASNWLYRTAPRGAQLVSANSNYPWAFVHYNWYSYTFLDTPASNSTAVLRDPLAATLRLMQPRRTPASYLILTKSQEAEDVLTGQWPAAAFPRLTRALLASGRFRVAYRTADAVILQVKGAVSAATTEDPCPAGVPPHRLHRRLWFPARTRILIRTCR